MTIPTPIHRKQRIAPQVRAVLVKLFPTTFKGKGKQKVPLKIGIFHDLVAVGPDIPRCHIRYALRDYTGGRTYLQNVINGAPRLDLAGNTSGFVTVGEAEHAANELKRLLNNHKRTRVLQEA